MKNFLRVLKDPAPKGVEDTGYMVVSQCPTCTHFDRDKIVCTAFPEGIPIGILMGEIDHSVPYDHDGVTDHGIQYEEEPTITDPTEKTMFDKP